MAQIVEGMVSPVMELYHEFDLDRMKAIREQDQLVNRALDDIKRYAASIPSSRMDRKQTEKVRELTEYAITLESAGDIVCPFNKFSEPTELDDFAVRHNLDAAELLSLFSWTENDFNKRLEGSAIRRIGFPCWQRNVAIALGNANYSESITAALENQRGKTSAMVDEHIDWAIDEQRQKQAQLT